MIKRLFCTITLLTLCLFASPVPAHAYNFFKHVNCPSAPGSAACTDNNSTNPLIGSNGLIIHIADIIAYIAGAAAVIILIISGLRFVTSGGDPEKVRLARVTATGALIGLAVIVLAKVLIDFVLSKL
jgi:Type IV secretion system pilin